MTGKLRNVLSGLAAVVVVLSGVVMVRAEDPLNPASPPSFPPLSSPLSSPIELPAGLGNTTSEVVGTWINVLEYNNGDPAPAITLNLRKDGTFELINSLRHDGKPITGTYTIVGFNIVLTHGEEVVLFTIKSGTNKIGYKPADGGKELELYHMPERP